MESRKIEINLLSAKDLKDINMFKKTKAYAIAWINNDPRNKQRTAVDKDGGTNPAWNHALQFTVNEAELQKGTLVLEIEIRTEGTFGDKQIGKVIVNLKEFVKDGNTASGNKRVEFVSYQVRKPSGKPKGILNMSVKLGEKSEVMQGSYAQPQAGSYAGSYGGFTETSKKDEPVTAYPANLSSSSVSYPQVGAYPPPRNGNQYPPPPNPYPPPPPYPLHQGYPQPPQSYPSQGYPPQGYQQPYGGYPPVVPPQQQQPPRKNKMGLGLGAGLLGGALGGLLIGDMIGDASGYDGGYDGGDFGGDF